MKTSAAVATSASAPASIEPATRQPASRMYPWLLLAVALYLFQTLPLLSCRWVTDESWYAAPGYSVAHGNGLRDPAIGPNDLENRFDARPPGTALVIAGCFKLLGVGPRTARLGSVLAGLGIVLLVYRLTSDILRREGVILATLLAATDNLLILTSRTARPEALTTCAVLLALLAMTRYAHRSTGPSMAPLGWAGLSGLLLACAAMFHVTMLGFVLSFAVLAVCIDRRLQRPALRGVLAYALGFLLGLLPYSLWILHAPLGRQGFQEEFLSRAGQSPVLSRMLSERGR